MEQPDVRWRPPRIAEYGPLLISVIAVPVILATQWWWGIAIAFVLTEVAIVASVLYVQRERRLAAAQGMRVEWTQEEWQEQWRKDAVAFKIIGLYSVFTLLGFLVMLIVFAALK